jgi:transposase
MHRKRPHVVSDVTGQTGRASMRALRAGARDPVTVARLRHARGHDAEATSAKALQGPWREEHRWALAQAVALDDLDHEKSAACDRQLDAHRGPFAGGHAREAVRPVVRPRKRTRHRPRVDVRGHRQSGWIWRGGRP